MITEKVGLKFAYMRFFIFLLSLSVVFACPKPEKVLASLKAIGLPLIKVRSVEPFKEIANLCRYRGVLKKGKNIENVDFYVSEDGKFFLPFAGRVVYKPSGIKGIKRITVVSLRNSNHTLNLGFITNDLKYYFPQIVPLPEK